MSIEANFGLKASASGARFMPEWWVGTRAGLTAENYELLQSIARRPNLEAGSNAHENVTRAVGLRENVH